MTTQQLHEILSLLPDDLILETDRRRCAGRTVVPFRRYAAVAACFALVLAAGLFTLGLFPSKSATETAQEPATAFSMGGAVAADQEAVMETQVAGEACGSGKWEAEATSKEPAGNSVTSTRSAVLSIETPRRDSGTACYASSPRITLIQSRAELEEYFAHYDYQYHLDALLTACEAFDEAWFQAQDLVLLAIHSVPADSSCEITSVTLENGCLEICAVHDALDPEAPETTDYHLLLSIEKSQIASKDAITLILDTPEG